MRFRVVVVVADPLTCHKRHDSVDRRRLHHEGDTLRMDARLDAARKSTQQAAWTSLKTDSEGEEQAQQESEYDAHKESDGEHTTTKWDERVPQRIFNGEPIRD